MRILLDTHVWLWMMAEPGRLSQPARESLSNRSNDLFLSAASAWEITIKHQIGKLPLPCPPWQFVPERLERDGITPLPIEPRHALGTGLLPPLHRDPFDRLLIAQAAAEELTLFSVDEKVLAYGGDIVKA